MSKPAGVVHLVDDDPLYLSATARLLKASGFTVKTFASGPEFLTQFQNDASGCLVADLRMPGMGGLDLQDALARLNATIPLIFLSAEGDIPTTVRAMQSGAQDFLEKTAPKERLIAAVRSALERAAAGREENQRLHDLRARFDALSDRQREVLQQVVQGKMNKEIAADLGIGLRTVKAHRNGVTTKLGVPSVAELTRLVQEAGLFQDNAAGSP